MNRLNRKLEYALMTLQYFSQKPLGTKIPTKEVCESTGSPFDATARVMQLMGQKGILKSEQGVRGGYFLSKNLDEVSFLELTETVLGPLEVAKCISGPLGCEIAETCNIKTPMQKINSKLRNFYDTLTVSEVLDAGPNNDVLKSMRILDCSSTPNPPSWDEYDYRI